MATYTELLESVDSVFSSSEWKGLVVPAFPANFFPHDTPDEFVVYEIIPSGTPAQEFADAVISNLGQLPSQLKVVDYSYYNCYLQTVSETTYDYTSNDAITHNISFKTDYYGVKYYN